MLANITFKAYETLMDHTKPKKTDDLLLTEFTLQFADTDKIDKICQSIEEAYSDSGISWTISIDHEYI